MHIPPRYVAWEYMRTLICRPIGVDGEHRVAKKKNLNNVIAKPAHMGSGLQHQAGAGPPRCRGSATPWLACPYGGGGTQCKGLLSQQMATTTNLRVEKSSLR